MALPPLFGVVSGPSAAVIRTEMGSLEKCCCCCIGGGSLKELSDSVVDQDLWLFSRRFSSRVRLFGCLFGASWSADYWEGGKLMGAGLLGTGLVIFKVAQVIVSWRFWIEMSRRIKRVDLCSVL